MRNGATKRRATYEDILALPENVNGEILNGQLIVSPRPSQRHARVYSVLGGKLGSFFDWRDDGQGEWFIYDEPELHLKQDILVPDLAGWRKERLAGARNERHLTVAPDWVCEVLSPSTARVDRELKFPIYARERVQHVWLVDPVARRLEVHRRQASWWVQVSTFWGDDRVRAEPFEDFELRLSLLWLPLPPQSSTPPPEFLGLST